MEWTKKSQGVYQSKKDWLMYYRSILTNPLSTIIMKDFARKEIMLILEDENDKS